METVFRTPEGFVAPWMNWYNDEPNDASNTYQEDCIVRHISGRTGDALISGTSTVRVNGLKSFLIHSLSRQVIVYLKSTKMENQVLSSFV